MNDVVELRLVYYIRNYATSSSTGTFLYFFRMILQMTSDFQRLSDYYVSCITKPNTLPLLHTTLLASIHCFIRSYSPFYEGSLQTISSLLGICGKSTQIKIETVVVRGLSIFEIKLSDFVVVTVNTQTQDSPVTMLQNRKMNA